MRNYIVVLVAILAFSCKQKENDNHAGNNIDSISNNSEVKKHENSNDVADENLQVADTITLNFKNKQGIYVAEGKLDSIHSKIYLKFKNDKVAKLNAKIIPLTGQGNIRFNQIIFPDASSDGPFGMELQTDLKQKGNTIIVIGHSLMADYPYFGKFKVEVSVE